MCGSLVRELVYKVVWKHIGMSGGVSLVPSSQLRWVRDLSVKRSMAVFISFCVLGWVSGMNLLLWASRHRAFRERGLVVWFLDKLCTCSS